MRDLTQGSIVKNLILFSLPMLFQSIFQNASQFAAMAFVGHLGKEVVAALTLAFPIMFLLIALIIGFSIGSTIVIAQFKGAKDKEKQDQVAQNSIVVTVALSVVLSILGLAFTDALLAWLQTPQEIWHYAETYLLWMFAGMISFFVFNALSSILRGVGDSKTPMISVIILSLLTIVFTVIFVYVFEWGIAGAAIAPILANIICSIQLWVYLLKRPHVCDIRFNEYRIDVSLINKILHLGLPTGIQQLLLAIGGLIILGLVNTFGTDCTAAFGVGGRIDMLILMPIMALGMGVTSMVGQNMGAQKYDRVNSTVYWSVVLAELVSFVIMGFIYFLLDPIILLFLPGESDFIAVAPIAREYTYVMFIVYPILSSIFVINSAFRGAGSSIAPMIFVLISQVILRLPIAYVFAQPSLLGMSSIWWSQVISTGVGLILSICYMQFAQWMKKDFIKQPRNPSRPKAQELLPVTD